MSENQNINGGLSSKHLRLVESAQGNVVFVDGRAGSGKTTLGEACVRRWLQNGAAPDQILVLLPSRTLAGPYWKTLGQNRPEQPRPAGASPGRTPGVNTLAGVAQELIREFWPQVNRLGEYGYPDRLPMFLNFEASQYFAGQQIEPLLAEGAFSGLSADPGRLAVKVLQNMNLAASAGMPVGSIAERLDAARDDTPGQEEALRGLQAAIDRLRRFFLEHNLLDYSLQIEGLRSLMELEAFWESIARRWKYLLVDSLEEQPAAAGDFIQAWLSQPVGLRPHAALLLYDGEGGFRWELGADPVAGLALKTLASKAATLQGAPSRRGKDLANEITLTVQPFYPQMLDWAAETAASLANQEGVAPDEIAILAPGMPEALSFALSERLAQAGVASHTLRPSLTLAGHPVTRALTILARLACPSWSDQPGQAEAPLPDLALALGTTIVGLDPMRAELLARQALRGGPFGLPEWENIPDDVQERVTPSVGERYRALRAWLKTAGKDCRSLGQFIRQANDWLVRPGFTLGQDEGGREVAANLADSIESFERSAGPTLARQGISPAPAYLGMLKRGLVAGQHLRAWLEPYPDAVLLAPARTFLLSKRVVTCQIWLEAGSFGWAARQVGALSNPYILHRGWPAGRRWSDQDELRAEQAWLERLVMGLSRRSRRRILAVASEINAQGHPERGPLLGVIQKMQKAG